MKTVFVALSLSLMLVSCQEPDWVTLDLPASPNGAYKAKLETLSEGGELRISKEERPWSDESWLSYGYCAGAEIYWSDVNTLVIAYDRMEITYFSDAAHHWAGAEVRLCNRVQTTCPEPRTPSMSIPSCNEFQMR